MLNDGAIRCGCERVERDDVRVLQLAEHLRLLQETPAHAVRIGVLDLDRHATQ